MEWASPPFLFLLFGPHVESSFSPPMITVHMWATTEGGGFRVPMVGVDPAAAAEEAEL